MKSFISETLSPSLCRQQRFSRWISFSKEGKFLAECSVQGHQDSGSFYLNLAPNCRNLANFGEKKNQDFFLRVFLESAKDIFSD